MSDFIYSKNNIKKGKLTKELKSIYHQDPPLVKEYHGKWGSLAISHNLYNGFQPYETTDHICVVIGGPVLCFKDNTFLNNGIENEGTKAIYNRWLAGNIQWDEDLSGPFVILIINKVTSDVTCITDLMSFIPVYMYQEKANVMFSTHIDVLASCSGQQDEIDIVSNVDFILHGVVTYPYTTYKNLGQIAPAAVHTVSGNQTEYCSTHYWIPKEEYKYKTLNEAAKDIRDGLQEYINAIAAHMPRIAQFISGGEDSRLLSALLPKKSKRDAYIFLDHMNREGKIAKKTAAAYGAKFYFAPRSKLHYLEILPASADLIGSGSQYIHAHTYGFHKSCKLNTYNAVFGGLLADALLKGSHIKKIKLSERLSFLPQIKMHNYSQEEPIKHKLFTSEVLYKVTKRRQTHLKYINGFRKDSAEEWFDLWPSSMNRYIPNIYANRRLFKSYEPFMSKDIVKISAVVPQKWKLNRRLFHKTAKPILKSKKWLFHSEGALPYFPWYVNVFVKFIMRLYLHVGRKIGLIKGNQGPWPIWCDVLNDPLWIKYVDKHLGVLKIFEKVLKNKDLGSLSCIQRINLTQILRFFHKGRHVK